MERAGRSRGIKEQYGKSLLVIEMTKKRGER